MRKKNINLFNLVFISILFLGLFIRLFRIAEIPPPIHVDEAFMTQSAIAILEKNKNLLDTYFSVTIVSNLITAFFIKLLGVNPISLRLQSVIFGFLTNLFLFLLIKNLFDKKTALISFFIASFSHVSIAYSRINLPNIQTPFFFVLSLYVLTQAIKQQKSLLFILGGLIVGLSFYSYTGAKIIITIVLLYFIINKQKLKIKFWLSFLIGLLFITGPIILYIFQPNNNYLERENQVFILNNRQYWHDRWQTDNFWVAFKNQFLVNFFSFVNISDYSNQYGNGPLLDKVSAQLFLFFFFILLPILVHYKNRKKRAQIDSLLFFLFTFLIFLLIISLTESPPLSTRLIILYPIISLFISLTINYLTLHLKNTLITKIYITTILLIILVLNLKVYFYDYMINKNATYNWIEPNSSIGFYAQKQQDVDIYLLPNPHTYADQAIISVLNYKKKKIKEIKEKKDFDELMTRNSAFEIIIPLVPKEASDSNLFLKNLVLESTNRSNFKKTYYWGIPCARCEVEPLFLLITKKRLN